MRKSDLKNGMRLTTKNGFKCIVALNPAKENVDLIGVHYELDGAYLSLKDYANDLTHVFYSGWDIELIEMPVVENVISFKPYKIRWRQYYCREDIQ